jgi:CDI immunity proteins
MKRKKQITDWKNQTIEVLENKNYGDPDDAPSDMVRNCLRLCRTPLAEFTASDLRLMIGQQFALAWLLPLAINHLKQDIFLEATFFPGDLLKNVLKVTPGIWKEHPDLWMAVNTLIENRKEDLQKEKIDYNIFENARPA